MRTLDWLAVVAMAFGMLMSSGVGAVVITETQTFDSAASAAAAGWTEFGEAGSMQIGFVNDNLAGGASGAGESQFAVNRDSLTDAYYADLTLGENAILDLYNPMSFTASIRTGDSGSDTGGGRHLAFFDSRSPISGCGGCGTPALKSFLGITFHVDSDASTSTPSYTRAAVFSADPSDIEAFDYAAGNQLFLLDNTAYFVDVAWDPFGGSFSAGLLTAEFLGPSGGKSTVELTQSQRNSLSGAQFDAFGWHMEDFGFRDAALSDARMDDVTYSFETTIPEPTTLGLFAAGLAGLGFSARRRKQAH